MPVQVRPSGPIPARIMIVGEAPGEEEVRKGEPFVGSSGIELNKMLGKAGIARGECFVTNVARERPQNNDIEQFIYWNKTKIPSGFTPYRSVHVTREILEGLELLRLEIDTVKPNIVVAVGNCALWALTGKWGITKWRGSMLYSDDVFGAQHPCKVIPTLHPAAILRVWHDRATVINDLRRAAQFRDGREYPKPKWNFTIRPNFDQVWYCLQGLLKRLDQGPVRLSYDFETRAGHIACLGISWSLLDAICIPFMCVERNTGYWDEESEAQIVWLIYKVSTHPNAEIVGQNILYDSQYSWRHWHHVPRVKQDTMISQHAIFSDLSKSLAYQASMYCKYYVYWKDEGKEWNRKMGEESLWYYNCEDVVYTDEAGLVELATVKQLGLEKVHEFQQKMFWPVLKTMQRGIRVDLEKRKVLTDEVRHHLELRKQFLKDVLGHDLNPGSNGVNGQMQKLFYQDLGLPVQMTRAKKGQPSRPTLDDDALQKLTRIEPIVKPIINCIADIRTLNIFLSTFLEAELDVDQRMRCSYNIGGSESGKSAPKTYRLSSSENAFGTGANLQNIPSEKSKSLGKAKARGGIAALGDPYQFPNIREIFIPDEGYTFWNGDLDRADLQVVVWESDDQMLKAALRMGVDIHLMNAFVCMGKEPPPLEELVETHPKYPDHRGPMKYMREFAKVFCHATNYGGGARTVAANTGRTVHEIDRAQRIWFGAHPGIKKWHERIEVQVNKHTFVENKFGYRWYIFDRLDTVLPEAIAWIPQSTVSIVINKIWMNIHENIPEVEILLQVHDSLAGQFPRDRLDLKDKIKEQSAIVVPYDDPLIIPFSLQTSEVSWGDC
jgi:uracil-DNA glycosylase